MFEKITDQISAESKFVFFTGAGISTDSGIKDFRSADGLYSEGDYEGFAPEEILSSKILNNKPELFFKYYYNKILHKGIKPNDGHSAIADIEKAGYEVTVVTQNIDGLHSLAGSSIVHELHGSVLHNFCTKCNKKYDIDFIMSFKGYTPICNSCNSIVRPDVVLYGEMLNDRVFTKAIDAISECDFIIAAGSSLTVYPASGLLQYFDGNVFCIVNLGRTPLDANADTVVRQNTSIALRLLEREICNANKRC